jgi:hypothetical protein
MGLAGGGGVGVYERPPFGKNPGLKLTVKICYTEKNLWNWPWKSGIFEKTTVSKSRTQKTKNTFSSLWRRNDANLCSRCVLNRSPRLFQKRSKAFREHWVEWAWQLPNTPRTPTLLLNIKPFTRAFDLGVFPPDSSCSTRSTRSAIKLSFWYGVLTNFHNFLFINL